MKGGRLAEVDSNAKQQFLVNLIHEGGGEKHSVWVGATDTQDEGQWEWSGSGNLAQ